MFLDGLRGNGRVVVARPDHDFSLSTQVLDGVATVAVGGDFGRTSIPAFERLVHRSVSDQPERVVVDVSAASIIDSAALKALLRLHDALSANEVRLTVVIGQPYQRLLFDVSGLSERLDVGTTPDPARAPVPHPMSSTLDAPSSTMIVS